MKILFLLPPSEGKNPNLSDYTTPAPSLVKRGITELLSFSFEKPIDIAMSATEKDLKCKGLRYREGMGLNHSLISLGVQRGSPKYEGEGFGNNNPPISSCTTRKLYMSAIERYSGVMYDAIDYRGMSVSAQKFFSEHFLILSGMYGILRPDDMIGNYKLPIETKGLYQFWWDVIPEAISELQADYIINLLPLSYAKLIGLGTDCNRHKKKLIPILESGAKIININFLKSDGTKISHGVKKIKGQWVHDMCEKLAVSGSFTKASVFAILGGEIVEGDNSIDVNIVG